LTRASAPTIHISSPRIFRTALLQSLFPVKSFPSHVRAVEALRRVALRYPLLPAERAVGLLRRRDLGLHGGRVGVNPLQLGDVYVEHLYVLADLMFHCD